MLMVIQTRADGQQRVEFSSDPKCTVDDLVCSNGPWAGSEVKSGYVLMIDQNPDELLAHTLAANTFYTDVDALPGVKEERFVELLGMEENDVC